MERVCVGSRSDGVIPKGKLCRVLELIVGECAGSFDVECGLELWAARVTTSAPSKLEGCGSRACRGPRLPKEHWSRQAVWGRLHQAAGTPRPLHSNC
jgi:hypothetical protein